MKQHTYRPSVLAEISQYISPCLSSSGAVIAGVLLVSLVLLILASATVWRARKRRERKAEEAGKINVQILLVSGLAQEGLCDRVYQN